MFYNLCKKNIVCYPSHPDAKNSLSFDCFIRVVKGVCKTGSCQDVSSISSSLTLFLVVRTTHLVCLVFQFPFLLLRLFFTRFLEAFKPELGNRTYLTLRCSLLILLQGPFINTPSILSLLRVSSTYRCLETRE